MARFRSIRYSRTLGLADAIALAAPICIAVGVYAVGPIILLSSGLRAVQVVVVAALLLVTTWVALLERTSTVAEGGAYGVAIAEGRLGAAFSVGQLSLLGYLALSILLVDLMVDRLDFGLEQIFGLESRRQWWILLLLLLTAARLLTGVAGRSKRWSLAVWVAVLVPVLLLGVAFFRYSSAQGPPEPSRPLQDWWTPVALLGAALWALEPVLARRAEIKRPERTLVVTAATVWVGTMAVALFGANVVLRDPGVTLDNWIYGVDPIDDRLNILFLLSLLFLGWTALVRITTAAVQLGDLMVGDRLLPGTRRERRNEAPSLSTTVGFHLLVALGATVELSPVMVAGLAAFGFFGMLTVTLLPWARTPARALPAGRHPRLPLHPLVPGFVVALSVFLTLLLPRPVLLLGALWVALSLLLWRSYARTAASQTLQDSGLLLTEEGLSRERRYRVLVAALDDQTLPSLLRLARPLAEGRDGEVLVVRVVEEGSSPFPSLLHQKAEATQRRLEEDCHEIDASDRIYALVRIAPREVTGILATATELDADLLLVPWSALEEEREEPILDEIFRRTNRPIAVLRGTLEHPPETVTVATSGGPHATFGIELSRQLAASGDVETIRAGTSALTSTASAAAVDEQTPARVIVATPIETGIVEATTDRDLLVVGAGKDRLLGRSTLGGVCAEIARFRKRATLLVRRAESPSYFLVGRLWDLISEPLPKLTSSERSEVFGSMRSAARANVDFYTLIFLSSGLATFGLRQSSTAVIIGAMLVAPLMSPILALAHGIVTGHLYMVRRAAASTAQGTATALGVAAALALFLSDAPPTPEMLARGAPSLLDLGVAVLAGAAAAYGVSRRSVAAALPGVAIAVALVPPLCVAGHAIGASEFTLAAGSFVLFLTNLAGIVLAGALVFLLLGFRPSAVTRDERVRRGLVLSALALLLLAIPLGWETRSLQRAQTLETSIEQIVREDGSGAVRVRDVEVRPERGRLVVRATVYLFGELDDATLVDAERRLSEKIGSPVRLEATVVRSTLLAAESGRVERTEAPSPPRE